MLPLVRAGALALGLVALPTGSALAISLTPFGSRAEGGAIHGQSFTIGTGGTLHELDAFVVIGGRDLNGASPGIALQLSKDPLPADLAFSYTTSLNGRDQTDLEITYTFCNTGSETMPSFTFLSFVDFEIDETVNTFFNEFAVPRGTRVPGFHWEADEPGFTFGNIFDHLLIGRLDDSNGVPSTKPEDVAMAYSLAIGPLAPGAKAGFQVFLSEDGESIGGLPLDQGDADPLSTTRITYSAFTRLELVEPVPEPASGLLLAAGLAGLAAGRRR